MISIHFILSFDGNFDIESVVHVPIEDIKIQHIIETETEMISICSQFKHEWDAERITVPLLSMFLYLALVICLPICVFPSLSLTRSLFVSPYTPTDNCMQCHIGTQNTYDQSVYSVYFLIERPFVALSLIHRILWIQYKYLHIPHIYMNAADFQYRYLIIICTNTSK